MYPLINKPKYEVIEMYLDLPGISPVISFLAYLLEDAAAAHLPT